MTIPTRFATSSWSASWAFSSALASSSTTGTLFPCQILFRLACLKIKACLRSLLAEARACPVFHDLHESTLSRAPDPSRLAMAVRWCVRFHQHHAEDQHHDARAHLLHRRADGMLLLRHVGGHGRCLQGEVTCTCSPLGRVPPFLSSLLRPHASPLLCWLATLFLSCLIRSKNGPSKVRRQSFPAGFTE